MSTTASPARVAMLAAVCMAMLGGCAGTTNGPRALFSAKPVKETDAAVLDAGQTADMQFAVGRMAEQQKQWPQAMTIYRQILATDPKHPEATHRMAILYDRQGEFDLSAQWFQKALKLKPGDPELFCDFGYSLSLQGRFREAEVNLRQAIAIAPDHRRSHNHLGVVLAQRGEQEEAIAAFRRANCSAAQAHMNLAVVLALNQQTTAAQQHLRYAQAQNLHLEDPATRDRIQGLERLLASGQSSPAVLRDGGPPQTVPPATERRPMDIPAVADRQLIETRTYPTRLR